MKYSLLSKTEKFESTPEGGQAPDTKPKKKAKVLSHQKPFLPEIKNKYIAAFVVFLTGIFGQLYVRWDWLNSNFYQKPLLYLFAVPPISLIPAFYIITKKIDKNDKSKRIPLEDVVAHLLMFLFNFILVLPIPLFAHWLFIHKLEFEGILSLILTTLVIGVLLYGVYVGTTYLSLNRKCVLRKDKKFPLGGSKGLFILPWKAVVGGIIANVATYFLYFIREPFKNLEVLGHIIPSLKFFPEAILVALGCAAGSIVTTYPQCV